MNGMIPYPNHPGMYMCLDCGHLGPEYTGCPVCGPMEPQPEPDFIVDVVDTGSEAA